MKFNLDNKTEVDEAFAYLTELTGRHAIAEVKRIVPARTLKQNSYLHLLIAAWGNHFGYTITEAKHIYKLTNKEIFFYKKKGLSFPRSSADLDKEEMTSSIDNFRLFSAQHGYELPLAIDQAWLRRLENEVERSKNYLEGHHGTE